VLATHGITDLSGYGPAGVADHDLMPDLFVSSLKEARSCAHCGNPQGARVDKATAGNV
jgi:hypothetical protein